MDHRALIASLSSDQRRSLTEKSNAKGLQALALHAGVITLISLWILQARPLWQCAMAVQGVLIIFLFTLLHEAIHRTAFKTRWLNDGVAHVCGFLTGVQTEWFRYFHFAHHRHTQDPDNDPELASAKPETRWQYIAHVSGLPLWWSSVRTLFRHAFKGCSDAFVPASARVRIVWEARLVLALYVAAIMISLITSSDVLLFIWVLPVLFGQPFLRLYLLAEHGRCPFVANMLENSRTTFTTALVRRLAWNMPYHAEHHSYPIVPFHQLPKLHDIAKGDLKTTADGYGQFHRSYVADLEG